MMNLSRIFAVLLLCKRVTTRQVARTEFYREKANSFIHLTEGDRENESPLQGLVLAYILIGFVIESSVTNYTK